MVSVAGNWREIRTELGEGIDWASSFVGFERHVLKIKEGFAPLTGSRCFRGSGMTFTDRVRDLVDCAYADRCRKLSLPLKEVAANKRNPDRSDMLIDVSQSHARRPFTGIGSDVRCLTTSSQRFWVGEDRVLCPKEHLMLQGYSQCCRIPSSMSAAHVKSAAGEGIALPPLGLVIWTLFSCHIFNK